MNVLDKIIAHKKQEIAQLKREVLVEKLVKSPGFNRTPLSLKESLLLKPSGTDKRTFYQPQLIPQPAALLKQVCHSNSR